MSAHTCCLNCGAKLVGEYCHKCGQSASTHRLSLKHFVAHDLVHGMWHVDRGILYTLKNLFTRPGHFVHEYINGKRAGHFNVVTLLLLSVGLFLYSANFYTEGYAELKKAFATLKNFRVKMIADFVLYNFKWLMLGLIPVYSIGSVLVFRRRKYYYTEHLVINGYFFAVFIIILVLCSMIFSIPKLESIGDAAPEIYIGSFFLLFGYWRVWKRDYTFGGWLWRMVVSLIIMATVILIIMVITGYSLVKLYPHKV